MAETKTRRRGAELERAILDAAWAELTEVGYTRLTIEAVAARAGTSKPVLYRRWSSRAELVLAAAWSRQEPFPETGPDTGLLRSDLAVLFTRIAERSSQMMNETMIGVMGEAFRHPEVVELLRERMRLSPIREVVDTIVRRAIDRGELPPFDLPIRVTRVPLDLVRTEMMTFGKALDPEAIGELVDDIYLPLLRGLAAERQR